MKTFRVAWLNFVKDEDKTSVDPTHYKNFDFKLEIFVHTWRDPTRLMEKPCLEHLPAAKRVSKNLKRTIDNALIFEEEMLI